MLNGNYSLRARIFAGFAAVYILWGSTYLAIRFAVASLPPLLMVGTRQLIAGLILYVVVRRFTGAARPAARHWRSAVVLGGLFFLGANGMLSWAEQKVPSGIAALILATVPFWMVLLNAANERQWPRWPLLLGLAMGVIGLTILVLPDFTGVSGHAFGISVLLAASLSWAVGSLYAPEAIMPSSIYLGAAMEMIAGGVLCWLVGLGVGEYATFHISSVSLKSLLALGYLIVFGSLAGFSTYAWLLKVSTPARVSTYAFVNPVIAVLLGWIFAAEAVTSRVLIAGTVIVAAVCLILYYGARRSPRDVT